MSQVAIRVFVYVLTLFCFSWLGIPDDYALRAVYWKVFSFLFLSYADGSKMFLEVSCCIDPSGTPQLQ